jgi:hypothetical protein
VTALSNGNYVVVSPSWNGGLGAATWANGANGSTLDGQHTIDPQNSILGSVVNSGLNVTVPGPLGGSFLVAFTGENGGRVSLGLTDPRQITTALDQGQTLTVTPGFLLPTLAAGTAVDLQAASTLTVASAITVSAGGHGGNLTLEAATLLLDAAISTDGGTLTFSGNISPGGSKPALVHLSAGTVSFKAKSTLAMQLNGKTPGTGYDQLRVSGSLNPSNATLSLSSIGHFAAGQTFVLIQDNKAITTTFAGLPEGSLVSAGGQKLEISYKNDKVTLTVQ